MICDGCKVEEGTKHQCGDSSCQCSDCFEAHYEKLRQEWAEQGCPDAQTSKGLAALDTLSEQWAFEVSLGQCVELLIAGGLTQEKLVAWSRQCCAEGMYRGFCAGRDMTPTTPTAGDETLSELAQQVVDAPPDERSVEEWASDLADDLSKHKD